MGDHVGPSVQDRLKPHVWFVDRQLGYKPIHFVTVRTPLTNQSAAWIINTLSGRFTFEGHREMADDFEEVCMPSFEDPIEATLYELTWS
jgi:predicted SpoU family rRNA methylase